MFGCYGVPNALCGSRSGESPLLQVTVWRLSESRGSGTPPVSFFYRTLICESIDCGSFAF